MALYLRKALLRKFSGMKITRIVTPCSHLQSWIKQSKIWNSFDSQYPDLLPINLFISCRYGIHLWDIGHTSMWEGRSTWSYNTDMMMELALYIVDFAHHLHMLVRMNWILILLVFLFEVNVPLNVPFPWAVNEINDIQWNLCCVTKIIITQITITQMFIDSNSGNWQDMKF